MEEGDPVAMEEGDSVAMEEGDPVAMEEGDPVAMEEGDPVAMEEGFFVVLGVSHWELILQLMKYLESEDPQILIRIIIVTCKNKEQKNVLCSLYMYMYI